MFSQFLIFSLLVLTIFAMWHLEWEKACPRDFPLPPSMLYFGPAEIRTHFRFIFDSEGRESRLSQVVTRAWETVSESEPGRQFMLFCWSGLNSIRHPQNCRTRTWTSRLPELFSDRISMVHLNTFMLMRVIWPTFYSPMRILEDLICILVLHYEFQGQKIQSASSK